MIELLKSGQVERLTVVVGSKENQVKTECKTTIDEIMAPRDKDDTSCRVCGEPGTRYLVGTQEKFWACDIAAHRHAIMDNLSPEESKRMADACEEEKEKIIATKEED